MKLSKLICIQFCLCLWALSLPQTIFSNTSPFPLFQEIKPNVAFWTDIYTQYPTTIGVIHDSDNLRIIYEKINLLDTGTRKARKKNKKKIKAIKSKYKKILLGFAKGSKPKNKLEKNVYKMFGKNTTKRTFKRASHSIRCQVGQKNKYRAGLIRSGAYLEEMKAIFKKHRLPQDLAYLPHVESSFNHKAYSKFGAAGMWQFIRSTGKRFLTINYTIDERMEPIAATKAAAKYLKENYKTIGNWPMALTAYNHGANGIMRGKKKYKTYPQLFKYYKSRLFKFASRNFYSEFIAARDIAQNYQKYFGQLTLDKAPNYQKVKLDGFADIKDVQNYFQIDARTIKQLNPAIRKPIFNGQKYIPKGYILKLPPQKKQLVSAFNKKPPSHIYKAKQKRSQFYRVQRGDTAGKIARIHRVKLSELILANNLNSRATIYVRQNLRIPLPGEIKKKTSAPKPQQTNKPKIPPTPPAAQPTPSIPPPVANAPAQNVENDNQIIINPDVVLGDLNIKKIDVINGQKIGLIQIEIEETIGHYADWLKLPTRKIRQLNPKLRSRGLKLHQQVKIPLVRVSKEDFEESRYEYHKEIIENFFNAFQVSSMDVYTIKKGDNIWVLCNDKLELPFWLIQHYNPNLDLTKLYPGQPLQIPVVVNKDEHLSNSKE